MAADRTYFQQFQKTRHVANVFGALLDNGDHFFFAHSLLLVEWWSTLPQGRRKMQVAENTRAKGQRLMAKCFF